MKKVLVLIKLLVLTVFVFGCSVPRQTYKVDIKNDTDIKIIGLKEEYEAGVEVEVKMEYIMEIETYVYLNGELLGTLNGYNSLKFIMPEKDIEIIISHKDNTSNICDNNEHQWDEGVYEALSNFKKYTCLICGETKQEQIEISEHTHNYIEGLCECGEFDTNWLNENFRISDEKIIFKGSSEEDFKCDIILLTLKHTTTYIELSEKHFKIDNIVKVYYLGGARPPEYFFEEEYKHLLEPYNQIVYLYVNVESKEEIIEMIRELEKLPFIRSANVNRILTFD